MIIFLLIIIIEFLDSISETIRVKQLFDASYFARYKGNWYIDPEVSAKNKYNSIRIWIFRVPFVIWEAFSDLYHTCRTLMFIGYFLMLPIWAWYNYLVLTGKAENYIYNTFGFIGLNIIGLSVLWFERWFMVSKFLAMWKNMYNLKK